MANLATSPLSKAYWAIKKCNMSLDGAGVLRKLQLSELEEARREAFNSALTYKEKNKDWHDRRILRKDFKEGDKVLLYTSHLRLFPGKLKSRWTGPYIVHKVHPHGAIELHDPLILKTFKVNGQWVKKYHEEFSPETVEEDTLEELEIT